MLKIFAKSEEKFLKAGIVHADSTGILYHETAKTNKVNAAEVAELFKKGLLVVDDGTNMYRPTMLTVGDTYTTVTVCMKSGSSAAANVNFYSDGYVAG